MKLFSCEKCQQVLFFESVTCTNCGHALGYALDCGKVCAIEPTQEPAGAAGPPLVPARSDDAPAAPEMRGSNRSLWRILGDRTGAAYRLCRNHVEHEVCNWLIPQSDANEYCRSCRLNHIIPNLGTLEAKQAWYRLEVAKRRVLYTLFELGLPVESRVDKRDGGLEFEFLKDSEAPDGPHVYTGHSDGIVTINIAEADDPFREKMRVQMGEAYRTVLGHFRHEIGHYYWDRLIGGGPHLEEFRALFGDERPDYTEAQQRHYAEGPPPDWPQRFVSAYASMHPWEDWAETWAHYLHMLDTLETARAFSLTLEPDRTQAPRAELDLASRRLDLNSFDDLVAGWVPLTMALNCLNRSMGLSDGYPFILSELAVRKLRFVHGIVVGAAHEAAAPRNQTDASSPAPGSSQPVVMDPSGAAAAPPPA